MTQKSHRKSSAREGKILQDANIIPPPYVHLSDSEKKLYQDLALSLDAATRRLPAVRMQLGQLVQTHTRANEYQLLIDLEGDIIETRTGAMKQHPACALRDSSINICITLVSRLKLAAGEPKRVKDARREEEGKMQGKPFALRAVQ